LRHARASKLAQRGLDARAGRKDVSPGQQRRCQAAGAAV